MPEMVQPVRRFLGLETETELFDAGFTWEQLNRDIERREDEIWYLEDEIESHYDKYWRHLKNAKKASGWKEERLLRRAHDEREDAERKEGQMVDLMKEFDVLLDIRSVAEDAISVKESPRSDFEIDLTEIDMDTLETEIRNIRKQRDDKHEMIDDLQTQLKQLRDSVEQRYTQERRDMEAAVEFESRVDTDELMDKDRPSIIDRDNQLEEDYEKIAVETDEDEES